MFFTSIKIYHFPGGKTAGALRWPPAQSSAKQTHTFTTICTFKETFHDDLHQELAIYYLLSTPSFYAM